MITIIIRDNMGGSPGLVVKGGDSKSEGCEFEYRHHIFFTLL